MYILFEKKTEYSGTLLNGHPSITDTSIIITNFWVPIVFPLTSMQPLHNGHPSIMDKIRGSKLSALEVPLYVCVDYSIVCMLLLCVYTCVYTDSGVEM